jgi:hypothetical protein
MMPDRSERSVDQLMGISAVTVVVLAIACIALPVPWQMRFAVVAVAGLFGPGAPTLRYLIRMELGLSLVIGMGVNIALLMMFGQVMLIVHLWQPMAAYALLLAATFAAGVGLLVRARAEAFA